MDLDLKENNSDSDLSDSWTLVNCSEHDMTRHENEHSENSDEESVESYGIVNQGLPRRDEESDGISVISESEVCDNTEAIPALENKISKKSLEDRDIRTVHSPKRRGIHHDSFSESDGCELANPADLSPSPKKGRKSRNNRPVPSRELDSCNYVEELPVLRAEPGMHHKDESCMRIYVHRPNHQINFILTILLALALAAVAGLGTGHFLGTKEVMITPEETIYKLQLENRILHGQLQELLREHEELKRNVELFAFAGIKNVNGPEPFYSECSKISDDYLYFQKPEVFLNRSLINSNIPVSVSPDSLKMNILGGTLGLRNFNMFNNNIQLSLLEQSRKDNVNLQSGKANRVSKTSHGNEIIENSPKQIPKGTFFPINKDYSDKKYHAKETEKLISEMKSALSHGLELSNKLKEAISYLDVAFANWKKSDGATLKPYKKSVEKNALKGFKHIFHDGGKAKKILSKTVDKLDSIKRKILEKSNGWNFWEDFNFKKNSCISGCNGDFNVGHESISNLHIDHYHNNPSPIRPDFAGSDELYGPHITISVSESDFICNIPSNTIFTKDTDNSVEETNPFMNKDIMKEDLDVVSVEDIEDGNTLQVEKVNFNMLPHKLNQVVPEQLLDELQNKPNVKEISSEEIFKSSRVARNVRDLNHIELPNQNLRQIHSEQDIKKVSGESKQKEYPSKLLSGELQNKPKTKEISSEDAFKSTKEGQSVSDLIRTELPNQNTKQIRSEQSVRKIHRESKQEDYPSKNFNKHSGQKASHEKHFKISTEEVKQSNDKFKSEENSRNLASKLHHQKSDHIHSKQAASKDSKGKSVKVSKEDFKKSHKMKSKENSSKDPSKPKHVSKEEYRTKLKNNSKSKDKKNYNNGNEKNQKNREHKYFSRESKEEKYEKKLKQKYEPKLKDHDFKPKHKFTHKKSKDELENYNKRKSYEESQKHTDDFKKPKYFYVTQKQGKKNDLKYSDQIAWLFDEDEYKFTNLTGEWLLKRNRARASQREKSHKSDWVFDRAISRRIKREEDLERARWYFQRARSRETCRVEPDSDWCKNHEKKDSHKFDRGDTWKRNRQFDDDGDDHYRRDWRTKHPSRPWRGTRFISQAFKAAMNFMKA